MSSNPSSLFSARHYRWLALMYALVALFASLLPLNFTPMPLETAVQRFQAALAEPVQVDSKSDWASNIMLFIPLGYLMTAALAVDRPRLRFLAALLVVVICGLFSASIEFTQLFFYPRVTSLNDIVAETIGGGLGALGWLTVGQTLTSWARRDELGLGAGVFPMELLPCCLLGLVIDQLLPLDITIQPAELYHKYKEGKVRLAYWLPWPGWEDVALRELPNIFLFLPIGVLLAGLGGARWRRWSGWWRVLGLGLLLVAGIKFVQLFVRSRNSFAMDVLTNALAILLGWALGLAVRNSGTGSAASKARSVCFAAAAVVWLVVVGFLNWHPFDFSTDLNFGVDRLRNVPLLPFQDYVSNNYLQGFDQIITRLTVYLPIGLILPLAFGWRGRSSAGAFVIILIAVWAVTVEIGQAFLPTRYPSLTDVLVETVGAWLGFWCAGRLLAAPRPELHQVRMAEQFLAYR